MIFLYQNPSHSYDLHFVIYEAQETRKKFIQRVDLKHSHHTHTEVTKVMGGYLVLVRSH